MCGRIVANYFFTTYNRYMSKACSICKEIKPLSDYYKSKGHKDGHMYRCKQCDVKLRRTYNSRKPEAVKASSKRYYLAHREQKLEYYKKWKESNSHKFKAHKMVQAAVKNGFLKKEPCWCGSTSVEGHHEDYDKPLDVIWFCHRHHMQHHYSEIE